MELPKFDLKASCIKCGGVPNATLNPQWRKDAGATEYLVWVCSCGYTWVTKTKDAK